MIQDQVIPIDFGQGVDTKTDPKAVKAGKFIRLENAVFTNVNRITKRNGYTALGTSSAPVMNHEYNGELIKVDSGTLSAWSPTQSAWFSRGKYTSTELSRTSIDQNQSVSGAVDSVVLGNYALYGWSTAVETSVTFSKTYGSVVDLQTGTTLVGPSLLGTASFNFVNRVRCVLLGASTMAVFYINDGGTAIVCRIVTVGVGSVTFGSELTVSTNYSLGGFDVVTTSTGAAIFYPSATGVTVATIDTAGTVTGSVNTVDATRSSYSFHVAITSNGNIWIYWVNTDSDVPTPAPTNASIVYAVYSSALAVVLAKTTIVALPTPFFSINFIATNNSATQQTLYYSQYVASAAATYYADLAKTVTITSAGVVGTPAIYAYGVTPFSRSFTVSSTEYMIFLYRGAALEVDALINDPKIQPTYFVVALSAGTTIPLVVARFGAGLANNQISLLNIIGYMPQVAAISASKVLFSCAIQTQEYLSSSFASAFAFPGGASGAFAYQIDFSGANSYRAVNAGQIAVLNGGVMQCYDGQSVSEFGFHLFPEITELVKTNTAGGAIANGTYSYIAIFQWIDDQGNIHQSATSVASSITLGGAEDTITATISTAYLSQKSGVFVALFRTKTLGTIYYQVSDPVFVDSASASGAITVSIVDTLADASIEGNPQAYTYPASSVLENSAPPPSMIMLSHNNRLWFVDSENPNTEWYTKSFSPGTGLSPSALVTQQIDPKYGNIIGLAEMDEKIVTLKEAGLCVQSGDGVNDIGTGSTLSFPQFVPSDVGCDQMKSIVSTPEGIMFHSPNGIYMLNRSLAVGYIGMEVESYNTQTITDARLIKGKSQIRFLCSSGVTLVYDYIFKQWSTFTAHTGVSATIWNSKYVYTNGTNVLQEATGTYTDNGSAFAMLAQTAWLALASIQGFQRVRRFIMLGDFVNGLSAAHAISVSAAYDFSTTFQSAISYVFGAASASGVFQYRERLPIQKCDSISLLIQETTTGSGLEFIDLTNMSFEAGVKKGVNKLGGSYSVG